MSINYKISRLMVKSSKWFKWKSTPKGLSQLQSKAYDLFCIFLKDENTELICSIKTMKRHIRNDDLLIMLYNTSNGFIISVIDESEKHNMYDVDIPHYYGTKLCNMFDVEMERKLRGCEYEKRMLIVKDLDELMNKKNGKQKLA